MSRALLFIYFLIAPAMVCVAGTGGYVVRGKVIDARSLAPLAYAAVRVQNLELRALKKVAF